MLLSEVIAKIEEFSPREFALNFDRVGLMVGDRDAIISSAVVTLDTSQDTVDFALSKGAQLIVSHHPLIWDPLATLVAGRWGSDLPMRLLRHNIASFAAHTNWDCASGGINDVLANLLSLQGVVPFGHAASPTAVQIGRYGQLAEPITLEQFTQQCDIALRTKSLLFGDPNKLISKVAVCGGAAVDLWPDAREIGAEVLVTGEVRQNAAVEACHKGFALIQSGHYATEHPGMVAFSERAQKEMPSIEWAVYEPAPGIGGRPVC